jgi:chorismate mutase/prephenate dehydratase
MGDPKTEIERLEAEAEAVDRKIAELLEERGALAKTIGAKKQESAGVYHSKDRHLDRIERHRARASQFPATGTEAVFREIYSACASLERPLRVACPGPEMGFGHGAAHQAFGATVDLRLLESIRDVFDEVERQRADVGIVPVESSAEGVVLETLDLLVQTPLKLNGSIRLEAALHLLNKTGNLADVEKVYGHASALSQCRRFLEERFGKVSLIDVRSFALAAQLAAEDHGAAAVGTSFAGDRYELRVARSRIEDAPDAHIRFLTIGERGSAPTGKDRTSVLFSVKDGPGALYNALKPLADRGVNLTKIESRPSSNRLWDYVFFIEVDGHVTDRALLAAIEDLKRSTKFVKILGSFAI